MEICVSRSKSLLVHIQSDFKLNFLPLPWENLCISFSYYGTNFIITSSNVYIYIFMYIYSGDMPVNYFPTLCIHIYIDYIYIAYHNAMKVCQQFSYIKLSCIHPLAKYTFIMQSSSYIL